MFSLNYEALKVAAVVTFYMCSALIMVFVNKAVLVATPGLPIVFVSIQGLIAVILLHFSSFLTKRVEIPKFDIDIARKLFPVVSVCIVGLVFNTLCLRGVEASFFQIARGLQIPLTIVLSTVQTHVAPSNRVLFAAFVVTAGFFLGVVPSADIPLTSAPSLISLFYGLLSSLFIAYHAVLIKSSLPYCNNSAIQLAWWSNAGGTLLLLPFIFISGEHTTLLTLVANGGLEYRVFLYGCLVTGFVGFLLSIAGLLSIKITSPVTHMFASAARSVIQTLLGVWIFNDYLTINRATSILVILGGTIFYTYIKSIEQKPSPIGDTAAQLPRHTKDIPSETGTGTNLASPLFAKFAKRDSIIWSVTPEEAEDSDEKRADEKV